MDPLADLKGIITVLNTPFTHDDKIDFNGLQRHTDYAIRSGVAGLLVPAMAAEVGKLSAIERLQIVESVIEETAGRIPVIGGASAASARERAAAAAQLRRAGCSGILVSIPFENEHQYRGEVEALAARDPGFLMLQDWDASGYGLPLDLIVNLFERVPAFRCLKVETLPAGPKYSAVLAATEGRLHVSGGWAVTQMIEALDRGVHAFMPTGLHRAYTRIYTLYAAGKRDAARELHEKLLPILAFSNQHLDISIHFFKRLLYAQGVYETFRVREPILPFDPNHERCAVTLIQRACELEEALVQR